MRNRRKDGALSNESSRSGLVGKLFERKAVKTIETGSRNGKQPDSIVPSDAYMSHESDRVKVLSKDGQDLFLQGDYDLALSRYAEALRLSLPQENVMTTNNEPEVLMLKRCESARILINIGAVKVKQGGKTNTSNAIEAFETSLRLARRVTCETSVKMTDGKENSLKAQLIFDCIVIIADALQNIAMIKYQEGDYTIAEEKIRAAIDSRRTLLHIAMQEQFDERGYSLLLAHTFEQLGNVTKKRGNARESINAYDESLKLRQAAGQDHSHPAVIELFTSLTEVYLLIEDYVTTLRFLDELMRIQKALVGIKDAKIIELTIKKSRVLMLSGHYDEALTTSMEAATSASQLEEDESENILQKACTFEQVADVYERRIELPRAIEWHEKALKLRSALLEPTHHLVVQSNTRIAHIHAKRGEYDTAFSIYKVQRQTLIDSLGVHVQVASLLDLIGIDYSEQRKFNAAIKHHMKAVEIRRSCQKTNGSPEIADSLCHIGVALLQKQRRSEAMHHFSVALQMYREAHFSAFHPSVVMAIRNMTSFDHSEDDLESTSVFS